MKEKFKRTVGVYDRPEGGGSMRTAMVLMIIALAALVGVLLFI